MEQSAWNRTLDEFRQEVDSGKPVPAGVSISVVTAGFALALLAKVLDIAGNRKNFDSRERALALRDVVRAESQRLNHLADDDVAAFHGYLEAARNGDDAAVEAAARGIIEVPMSGARAAVRGLELCEESTGMVRGSIAADLGIAAALLSGAARAMLISVDSNLADTRSGAEFRAAISTEREELRERANRLSERLAPTAAN